MSQNTEVEPFRTRLKTGISNFLQKYRTLLASLVGAAILITAGLALWTQVDAATKADFAARIEKSQADYLAWAAETDAAKKEAAGKTLEAELAKVQKEAPQGYGLSKAWFIQGNYFVAKKQWMDASKAFRAVFDKDKTSYLAPVALLNAAVCEEEAGDAAAALAIYGEFEKAFGTNALLLPQVYFTEGRLLESLGKTADAGAAYKKLLEKYPESGWTKLGRDRIISLNLE